MKNAKFVALTTIDDIESQITQLSDTIWDIPELGFQEYEAARLQCELLEKLGFRVERKLGGLSTAFSGSWGSGKPVIAFMGEFDALSGMSQKSGVLNHDPVTPNGSGHGCGHNLLGCGALAAAYATKEYLRATGIQGTVIYYGCPAEEGGSGKTFMAREAVFEDLDCTLYWHPGTVNKVGSNSSLANFQVKYRFHGVSAHAAAAPHIGRSALDAVELMNTGVQYLREHVLSDVRIHYAITNAGGASPGVVQADAEVCYIIRAHKVETVQSIYERVNKIAQGAALMTETELDIQFETACSDQIINQNINDVLQANMEAVPLPQLTPEDLDFARLLNKSSTPIAQDVIPRVYEVGLDFASGDLGDVSRICPTGEIAVAVWAKGTSAHTWQATAQGKMPLAHKGMIYAAKVLAGAAIDLFNDPNKIAAAKNEHIEAMHHKSYVCPIPADVPAPM